MNKQPLSLAVVGHTNTGKTSLLRTLLRDSGFGEVKNAPSTTRHVEEAAISDGADTLVFLYDTPGLEDAGGVLEWLETHTDTRSDGIERLQQ
ncbi:GTPase domain-containing protein, partial [Klebsiella pneumoniae]|nr:GTPase domain-containing protein [Klebsiella pneumoniae]